MRQSTWLTTALTALLLAGCGPAELVVTAELEVEDPETGTTVMRNMSNLRVDLIPYDRDLVFDSLTRGASTPEPAIPADVLEAQAAIAGAQAEWRNQENRWGVLRDTLQKLTDRMRQMAPSQAEYRLLFQDEATLRRSHDAAETQAARAFTRYDSLQKASIARQQEVRLVRETWADEAFADVGDVFRDRLRAAGLPMAVDTTDAGGRVSFSVKPGTYWVHARFDQPYTELYWNVQVTLTRGEPFVLVLTPANALERPRL